jgi:hypothetical protein
MLTRTVAAVIEHRKGAFGRAGTVAVDAQLDTLGELLKKARHTEWGRRYGFATDIRTHEQFRLRVPITPYEQAAPQWHRAFEGQRDIAWPGHVRYFAMSSGTTAGNKLLPVTDDAIASNRRAGAILAAVMLRRGGRGGGGENLLGGRILYLGGSTTLKPQGQSFSGDASGIMARNMPFYFRRRHLPPPEIAALSDWEEKITRLVASYLTSDIVAMGACPSWAAMLFGKLLTAAAAAGRPERTIGELWPKLSHFISYGMAFAPYRASFDAYIGRPLHYVDTYSSSETGMAAIQEEEGGPLTMLVDNGVFYEFVPAEEAARENPTRLHIGQVQTGRDYAVVISSNGGLWAYPLGDVIRFESLAPPRILFAGRTQLNLSAFGEHVDLRLMEQAIAAACTATSARVADYTVQPIYPGPSSPVPRHRWIVEFEQSPADAAAFMAAVDNFIRKDSEDYDAHRTNNYGLLPPELVAVPRGTFYAWMKSKGKLGGQHKVPRVAREVRMAEEILALAKKN